MRLPPLPCRVPLLPAGHTATFAGFNINAKLHHFALTQVEREMLRDIAKRIDAERTVPIELVRSYTHKAAWAVQVSEPLRPVLQPLFHFIKATEELDDHARIASPLMP